MWQIKILKIFQKQLTRRPVFRQKPTVSLIAAGGARGFAVQSPLPPPLWSFAPLSRATPSSTRPIPPPHYGWKRLRILRKSDASSFSASFPSFSPVCSPPYYACASVSSFCASKIVTKTRRPNLDELKESGAFAALPLAAKFEKRNNFVESYVTFPLLTNIRLAFRSASSCLKF